MYSLTIEQSFDSAHFLSGYVGKCGNIHGHRWKVILEVQSMELRTDTQQRGMCVDFAELKKDLKKEIEILDHTLIIEKGSLKQKTLEILEEEGFLLVQMEFRPTAENFSKYFYEIMSDKGYDVSVVHIYETPNNCASYWKA